MIEKLAREFSRLLRRDLSDHEMSIVVTKNNGDSDTSCCHSHDFCDANMVMAEAFENVVGRLPTMTGEVERNPGLEKQHQQDFDLWNAAWSMAKANHFYPEK